MSSLLSTEDRTSPIPNRTASSILDEGFRALSAGPAHAITLAREALDRSEVEGDKQSVARAHLLLASGLRRTGDVLNALEVLERAEALCTRLDDRKILGPILQQQAGIFTSLGRPDEAVTSLKRAELIATEFGDTSTLQHICTTWALVYMRRDRYAEAIEMLQKATELFGDSPEPSQVLVVLNMFASIYQRSRNHQLAMEYLEKSLQIARDLEASQKAQPRLHCSALICLVESLKDVGRFQEMLPPLEEARGLAEKYDLIDVQASVARGFGDNHLMENRFSEAIEHFLDAKELLDATGNRMILITVLHSLGACCTKIGEFDQAEEYLLQALTAARGADSLEKEFSSHKLLAELYTAQNDIGRANESLHLALASHEQIFNESNQRALRETEKRIVEAAANREHALMQTRADALSVSHQELQVLNKHQTEILHIVSHDMRNPLSAIFGMSGELASNDSITLDDARTIGKIIHDSSQKLISLTDQLLLTAQLEIGATRSEPKEVLTLELVEQCLRLIRPQAIEKEITVSAVCQCDNKIVTLDVERFSHIINNLVSNAVKFTNPGGEVKVACTADMERLLLTVTDTGIGIPDELLHSLFEQFNPDRRNGTGNERGTGLGLPLVKKLVELEGGSISIRSVVGEGTVFEVAMPIGS